MKKKVLLLLLFLVGIIHSHNIHASNCASGDDPFCYNQIEKKLKPVDEKKLGTSVVDYIGFLTTFLYTIAVIYGIYGGFQILSALEDDEKVKKGKKIIIQACVGLIIVFLASTIVNFIISPGGLLGQ